MRPLTLLLKCKISEWQIVCTVFSSGLCWREWRRSGSRCCRSSSHFRCGERLCTLCGSLSSSRIYTLYIPGTNTVVPSSLILMCINVERYDHLFTNLNGKLVDTICSKNIKCQLLRILVVSLQDIRASLPFTTCRNTTSFRQYCNNFTL